MFVNLWGAVPLYYKDPNFHGDNIYFSELVFSFLTELISYSINKLFFYLEYQNRD